MVTEHKNKKMRVKFKIFLVMAVCLLLIQGGMLSQARADSIVAWGNDGDGQVSDAPSGSDFVDIAGGGYHSLALKDDGTVVGWGDTGHGRDTPPADLAGVEAIAAGESHSLALKDDGSIVGWGSDFYGQATPPAGIDFVAIAAGHNHGLALKDDGTVVGWGDNSQNNQATPPTDLTGVVAIAAGARHSLALKADGTVVGWGYDNKGQATPPAGIDFVAIAAGTNHSLALKADGSIVGWGDDYYDQATPPAGLTGVVAIAARGSHSLALKADGSIVGWGANALGQATPPAGNNFVAISAGETHSLALSVPTPGSIEAWGRDNELQVSDAPSGNDFVAIAAGGDHGLALNDDGTVVGWGEDEHGQASPPADLTGVVAIAAGESHSLALKIDGTVVGWGWNYYGQRPPDGLAGVEAIAAGGYHGLALKTDGTVVGWGYDQYGQDTPPPGLAGVVAISAGGFYSLAIVFQPPLPNTSPTADAGGPYLGAAGSQITFDGTASDDPDGGPLVYDWDFGDGDTALDAGPTPSHTYVAAGIYDVCLTVTDPDDLSDTDCTLAVVYDPSEGFVTGGGWIWSPLGAYMDDENLEGKANFGFVSKYKKGANVPTGNTAFVFEVAELEFHSTSYDWLVVTGSNYARFKGTGTINGSGEYKFHLWAGDGDPDTFRIRIWTEDEETAEETDIYDNGFDQAIDGGSIKIHTK